MKRTVIIGSGITALAKAWQIVQRGEACIVLEPSAKIGGAIQSYREGEHLAEEGPNSIQIASHEVDAFLKSIPQLEERMIEAKPEAQKRFIVRNGKPLPVPTGPLSAITTPLWSFSGKLRVLKEPFIKAAPPQLEESAADFTRRRLGEELYKYAINPLIGGIYAGDPEQLSLRYAFPKLYALEQTYGGMIRGSLAKMKAAKQSDAPKVNKRIISFKDGLGELTQKLAEALSDRMKVCVSIQTIQQDESEWMVAYDDETERFDEIILTTPSHALSKLPVTAEIQEAFDALEAIHYPPVSSLSLAFKRSDVAHPIDGFGALVPECEGRKILGVLFPSSVFEGRAPDDEVLLTVFIGGERQPEIATANTEKLLKTVMPDLRELLGISGDPTFTHHRHWTKAIPQYKIGYGERLAEMDAIEARFPGLKLAGNYRTGISLTYCIESAL